MYARRNPTSECKWVDSENNKIKNDLDIVWYTTSGFDANDINTYAVYII